MSGYKIFNYKTFDIETEVAYQNPTKTRGNNYMCHFDKPYDVLIQTKDTILKSGIVENDKEAYIEIDVNGTDLQTFIEKIDAFNIDHIFKKCKEWFDQDIPYQAIKEFYISNVDSQGTLKIAVPYVRKKVEIKVYDDKKNLVEHNNINPGSKVVLIFRINGLKFLKQRCIMDIDVVQIMLMRNRESVVIPSNEIGFSKNMPITDSTVKNDMLNRIQFREKLKEKKEEARLSFEEAEKAQLHADTLKERTTQLAKEYKQLEEEFYKDDEEMDEEE
jgi:hypothetical protein